MKENQGTQYSQMDIGSAPAITVPMEIVEVEVTSEALMGDYARAFVREASRVNPLLAEQVKLEESELVEYAEYLLTQRIRVIRNDCPDFRRLKVLYIPSFLQYMLSMIGQFVDRSFGLKFIPVVAEESKMTFEQALAVSEKIGSFERCLQIVQDAMPRSIDGDPNVMSTALIAGYVRSIKKVDHPAATYVTAFLGMTLRKEAALSVLYRVQYDDVDFITAALLTHKGLF
jgi:hypothetical protein